MIATPARRGAWLSAALAALAVGPLAGCQAEGSCASASWFAAPAAASCAAGIEYLDHFYVSWSTDLPATKGARLDAAVYPSCDDGNSCAEDLVDRPAQAWTLRGVDPDRVIVGRPEGSDRLVVYGRLHA